MSLPRVAILNSYNLPGRKGSDSLRVRWFLEALAEHGFAAGRDFDYQLIDINERPAMDAAIRQLAASGVDLIQAFGTPNAMTALAEAPEVPLIYAGAHPERLGEDELGAPNVTGRILTLPFTSSYKSFRFLRKLLPRVEAVWTVFFEGTMFVPEPMRELHRAARDRAGRRLWLSGTAGPVGFRSLAGLCAVIGVEYRELVFSDAEELSMAIEEIDPQTGVFMNYTELLHCRQAFETVLARSAELGVPTIFNNNAQAAAFGFLAGIAANWAKVGRESGETAARILSGTPVSSIPREIHPDRVAWINLGTARRLGLDLDDSVLGAFDLRIDGPVDALCM